MQGKAGRAGGPQACTCRQSVQKAANHAARVCTRLNSQHLHRYSVPAPSSSTLLARGRWAPPLHLRRPHVICKQRTGVKGALQHRLQVRRVVPCLPVVLALIHAIQKVGADVCRSAGGILVGAVPGAVAAACVRQRRQRRQPHPHASTMCRIVPMNFMPMLLPPLIARGPEERRAE